jgi:DMSO reductase family type II enzyme chaperone
MEDIMTGEVVTSGRYDISQIYLFLGRCFSYPTKELMMGVGAQGEFGALVDGLPFEVEFKGIPSPSLPRDEFESEYINTFDIGFGPALSCSLYETAYSREDMNSRDVYEDLFRFYEHFDIRLNENEKDYPDHLAVELEFMAYLTQKEAQAEGMGKDPLPYRLAQKDFMERHLTIWVPELNKRIHERVKEPFYREASSFMAEFMEGHLGYLRSTL